RASRNRWEADRHGVPGSASPRTDMGTACRRTATHAPPKSWRDAGFTRCAELAAMGLLGPDNQWRALHRCRLPPALRLRCIRATGAAGSSGTGEDWLSYPDWQRALDVLRPDRPAGFMNTEERKALAKPCANGEQEDDTAV